MVIPRYYFVYNTASGFSLGIFRAASADDAVAAMLDDAACDEEMSPTLSAVSVDLDRALEICNAADDGGMLSGEAALRLFPGQPLRHGDQTLTQAWGDEWPGIDTAALRELLWG